MRILITTKSPMQLLSISGNTTKCLCEPHCAIVLCSPTLRSPKATYLPTIEEVDRLMITLSLSKVEYMRSFARLGTLKDLAVKGSELAQRLRSRKIRPTPRISTETYLGDALAAPKKRHQYCQRCSVRGHGSAFCPFHPLCRSCQVQISIMRGFLLLGFQGVICQTLLPCEFRKET
jgi:hypothetical protein